MDQSARHHATKILEQLEGEDMISCLRALKHAEDGQRLLASGEFEQAIKESEAAVALFRPIPASHRLMGIALADLAAEHGSLGDARKAAECATECLTHVAGFRPFAFTEAMANMTLGISRFKLGSAYDGRLHFDQARSILRTLPDAAQHLEMVEQNHGICEREFPEARRPWWQFWRRS